MGDVNPNVPLTGQTTDSVEITNGDSAASFDELESMFLNPENRTRGSKKKEAKDSEEPETQEKKSSSAKSKDISHNAEPAKAAKSEAKEKAGEDKDPGEKAQKELDAKARKILKARLADKELEFDEETEFINKADGQDVPIKLKDLLRDHSGKTAWDKRFSEVEKDRRVVRADNFRLDQMKSEIKDMFSEQDPTVRLFKMAKLSGTDPLEFRKKFFDETIKEIETYYAMSDEEKKARDLEFENRFYKHQADAAQKTLADRETFQELDKKVKGLLQHHGIGLDKFVKRYEELGSFDQRTRQALEAEGKLYQGKPTPDFIVETIQKDNLWESVESALDGVKQNWNEQQRIQNILMLVNDAYQNGIKPQDMPEIVSELWGKGKAKKVVEAHERERQEHYEGKREVPTRNSSGSEPIFFDEL